MNQQPLIDNHVHIGVDPLFYLNGWSPYCLDLEHLMIEAAGHGIGEWVVFPFVSYFALDARALRRWEIELDRQTSEVPYEFENRRLARDISRLEPDRRALFRQFVIADPGRHASDQVRVWESLEKEAPLHGIKIQPTIIRSPITTLLAKGRCMVDFAAERNLPFVIHSSIAPDDAWSQCTDILSVAEARTDVRFVLAHSCRFHQPSLEHVARLPNTWFDCSAHIIHCQCAVSGLATVAKPGERFPSDYSRPAKVLEDLATAYPTKLIWGTDAPFYSYADEKMRLTSSYRDEADALGALSPALREQVARKNTLEWLTGKPTTT